MARHAQEEQVRGQCDAWVEGGKLAVETQTITAQRCIRELPYSFQELSTT